MILFLKISHIVQRLRHGAVMKDGGSRTNERGTCSPVFVMAQELLPPPWGKGKGGKASH